MKKTLAATFALFATFAAITRPAVAAPPASVNTCTLKQVAAVDLVVANNEVYVPVAMAGHPAWMVLNTASANTYMGDESVRQFGLLHQNMPSHGVRVGLQEITHYVIASPFRLGSAVYESAQILVVPEPKGAKIGTVMGKPVVGAMGMDFFTSVDLELDIHNRRLNLFSQDHCPGGGVYWTDNYAAVPVHRGELGNLYFPMELEGKKIEASMATGNRFTTLGTDVTRRLYGFDEHSAEVQTETDSQGNSVSHYRAMAITTTGLNVSNSKVVLLPHKEGCGLRERWVQDDAAQYDCTGGESPLRLGLNVLEKLHLYFATKENVLYFSASDTSN